jgi:hypothetical protein
MLKRTNKTGYSPGVIFAAALMELAQPHRAPRASQPILQPSFSGRL